MALRRSTRLAAKNNKNKQNLQSTSENEKKNPDESRPVHLMPIADHINIMENESNCDSDSNSNRDTESFFDSQSKQDSEETDIIHNEQSCPSPNCQKEEIVCHTIDNDLIVLEKSGLDNSSREDMIDSQGRVCVFDDCGYKIFQDLRQYTSDCSIEKIWSPPIPSQSLNQALNEIELSNAHSALDETSLGFRLSNAHSALDETSLGIRLSQEQNFRECLSGFENNDFQYGNTCPRESDYNYWQDEYDGFNSHNIIHGGLFRQSGTTYTLNQTFGHTDLNEWTDLNNWHVSEKAFEIQQFGDSRNPQVSSNAPCALDSRNPQVSSYAPCALDSRNPQVSSNAPCALENCYPACDSGSGVACDFNNERWTPDRNLNYDSFEVKSESCTDKINSPTVDEVDASKNIDNQISAECKAENARMEQIYSEYLKKYKEKLKRRYTIKYKSKYKSKYKLKYKLKYKKKYNSKYKKKYESLKRFVKKSFERLSHSIRSMKHTI